MFQSVVEFFCKFTKNKKPVALTGCKEKIQGNYDACKGELRQSNESNGYYGKWWMFEMVMELPRKQKMSLIYFLVSLTFCLVQSIRLILRLTQ